MAAANQVNVSTLNHQVMEKKTERVFEKSGSFHGVGCPTEAKGGQAMEATTPAYPLG